MKTLSMLLAVVAMALTPLAEAGVKNIVIVHGAFTDGSGWRPIATILEHDGYSVYVVQEPLTSWDADLAATRNVLDRAGPCGDGDTHAQEACQSGIANASQGYARIADGDDNSGTRRAGRMVCGTIF